MHLEDYLDQVASKNPAPGGGSVAALAGVFAASLVSKLCNLTIGREKYKQYEEELKEILFDSENLRKDLQILAEEDTRAYIKMFEAGKLYRKAQKENLEDTPGLKSAYEEAVKHAADVPYRVMDLSYTVLNKLKRMIRICNKNALTDGGVAVLMAASAIDSAAFNVFINLRELSDNDYIDSIMGKVNDISLNTDKIQTDAIGYIVSNIL
ncbi:cyclodeaminase/cyclohydrolase family protein [Candidatus Woesearchaeota archaeon]|nr:cyclodeaminase/cyclohydrolase family protein [Candidatus Woesearchaeota archaeon]